MATPEEAYAAYYYGEYVPAMAKAAVRLFEWQNHANEVLLWVVSTLVASGVLLAAYQLHWSMRRSLKTSTTDLSIGAKGAKISSPIVGLSILVISFSFFIMFVREVYTIKQPSQDCGVGRQSPQELAAPPKSSKQPPEPY